MNTQALEILSSRSNPMIDPALHAWGWEVPVYLFLGGVVAGLMILVPLLELRTGRASRAYQHTPLLAAVLLSLGMGALFLDLENPLHVFRFYLTFRPTSPMSWGAWILVLVYPALVLSWAGGLASQTRERLSRLLGHVLFQRLVEVGRLHRATVLWLSIALGTGLGAYTGLLLGTMAARMQWNTAVLGPLFLVSGVSTGAALLLLLQGEEGQSHLLVRWDSAAILVELALIAAMLVGFSTSGVTGHVAASALLGGPFTPWFWSLVVVAGLLVPLGLNLVELRHHKMATLASPLLVLLGGLSLRIVLVAAGQASSFSMLH